MTQRLDPYLYPMMTSSSNKISCCLWDLKYLFRQFTNIVQSRMLGFHIFIHIDCFHYITISLMHYKSTLTYIFRKC